MGAVALMDPPFTVGALAARWDCSDELVYGLIQSGQLRAWKLGGKLWRIGRDAVGEYECQQNTGSATSHEGGQTDRLTGTVPLRGLTTEDRTASRLERMIEQPRRPQLVHSGHAER